MLVRSSPSQSPAQSRGPTVRRAEWSTQQEGVQHHAQVETTHWSAPQHSYGKVVADVAMRSNGHAVQARRQVEVLSARAPGVMRVLKATITSSSTSSSSTTQRRPHFDDLQLSVNPLDISSQKERTTVGRSGALGGRRPPTRGRPTLSGSQDTSSGDDKNPLERLTSPSIVANGVSKFSKKNENQSSSVDIVEVKSDSDKNSIHSDEPKYKVNFPDNESEDSFYDSCPEKDSIFKDESEQLEEWRRSSKIRRSLQFPKRTTLGKPLLDLPDNWGTVSRIKKELENFHNLSSKYHNPFSSLETNIIKEEESENSSTTKEAQNIEDLLIKPSALKTKSFISLETLNEVRGRLKNSSVERDDRIKTTSPPSEKDDGIETEDVTPKVEESPSDVNKKSVRSYVFGMEAMLNTLNDSKPSYPGGTNSLESRVSKLSSSATRSDDWYLRRKSYGFEKVGQKNETLSLANHLKNNIESSTDSGICRSSELVNSINNGHLNDQKKSTQRGTVVNIEPSDRRETFEDWLQKNRKAFSSSVQNKYKCLQESSSDLDKPTAFNCSYSDRTSLNIPIKSEELSPEKDNVKQLFHRKLSEGTTLTVESRPQDYSKKSEDSLFPSKRHTIAVDGIKEIRELYEQKNDSFSKSFFAASNLISKMDENLDDFNERKNKKVEFCKTEVHFAAESGRINIVETDEKPPSTNNFRRRRRNSGIPAVKEEDKNKLPITHFGDNLVTPVTNNGLGAVENVKETHGEKTAESLSLSKITQNSLTEDISTFVQINGEFLDADSRRGILKNKPIKPTPYHLGEDREIKPENNESSENNNNLWGVKLKPVKDSPLWKSSVLLNGENQSDDNEKIRESKSLFESSVLSSVQEVSKVSSAKEIVNNSNNIEAKGYSTKVNIANGDAIVQTVFHQANQFINSEDCYVGSQQRISNVIVSTKKNNNILFDPNEENVTTKICIDVTQTNDKNNIIQNSKITDSNLYALKSTALVKDTVGQKNVIPNDNKINMVLIEKNDRNEVKTAYKSKLCELRKMYEGREREGSEDSADEEVGRLMGITWSRRRAQRNTNLIANTKHNINIQQQQQYYGKGIKDEDTKNTFKTSNLSPLLGSPKNYLIMERKQNLERSMNSSFTSTEKQTVSKSEERKTDEITSSFGDTLNTPRALLPGRGSARKLKDHELTYFGVKDVKNNETSVAKSQSVEVSQSRAFKQTSDTNKTQTVNTVQQKYKQEVNKYNAINKQEVNKYNAINKQEVNTYNATNKQEDNKYNAINKQEVNKYNTINKQEVNKYNAINKQPQFTVTSLKKKEPEVSAFKQDKHIYENVNIKNAVSHSKAKHPGESIIEELTKAADEILQALNGFSGGESGQPNSSDDDARYRNSGGRSLKPLETITESNSSKVLENKAVQANLPYKEKKSKHAAVVTTTQKKTRSSSNSSLESVSKENVNMSRSVVTHTVVENGHPEKPHRKKISSLDTVKARRLQRASSRDALLKVHGSSSEDLPGNTEGTVKRKSLRRMKSGDLKKSSNTSLNTHSSASVMEEKENNKYSLKSITSLLPEIRHKTAISTIKPISDKTSSKEKSSKSKTNSKEKSSRRRDKLQEATISSMNRSRPLQREKSRSADTSLERSTASYLRDKTKNKDTASYHGDEITESNNLKYITIHEMNGYDKRKSPDTQQSMSNDAHGSRRKKESYNYHRERSSDKLTSYFKTDESKSKQRDSSAHRTERSQDKHKSKESSKRERSQLELGSKSEQVKEKSSKHRDSSHDRMRSRDSTTNHRDKSNDRSNSRRAEEKKSELSKLRKLLGNVKESPSANTSDKIRVVGGSSGQTRSSTYTRTEHD